MKIADFLEAAREEILGEAVAYARTIMPLKAEDEAVLRDHLPLVLEAISTDLRTPQSRTESIRKSHGRATREPGSPDTAAEAHGLLRARSGLHIEQVVAEYRALRSSVLRLWGEAAPASVDSLADVGRFNEAIDQALAESVQTFAAEVEHWQQIFLAVLGHDLRGPLNAIVMTTELLAAKQKGDVSRATLTLQRSARRMAALLDSLLEYNRAGLGVGMVLELAPIDLAVSIVEEVEVQGAALPGAKIELSVTGDMRGNFDSSRIREAAGNLITNAVKHGIASEPVVVKLEGDEKAVHLTVENATAHEIAAGELDALFEPLRRGNPGRSGEGRTHLGLGLFIVRQIARAHGGEVLGYSSAHKVRFTITLPRSGATSA